MGRRPKDGLSGRELEVLALAADGLMHKQIAVRTRIETTTVRDHLRHCRQKLGALNTAQAVAKAYEAGLLPHPRPQG